MPGEEALTYIVWSGRLSLINCHLSRDMQEMREGLMRLSREFASERGKLTTKLEVRAEGARRRVVRNEVREVAGSQII